MAAFIADVNFDNFIVRGLRRRDSEIDIVRVQDIVMLGDRADDPKILEWAAQHGRILLTHDVRTMTKFAYDRVIAGVSMPGVIEVRKDALIGQVIEDILFLAQFEEDLVNLGVLRSSVDHLHCYGFSLESFGWTSNNTVE